MSKLEKVYRSVKIDPTAAVDFRNHTDYCIGTGRMGLALQQEYQDQLKMVQEVCHFKHIRGHGLFTDDMAIYQCHTDADGVEHVKYNFTYLDRVMDSYLANGLRPFIELGFMPQKLASGTQTIFYWKGNTTPPKDDEGWARLVVATLTHLMQRYGKEEVLTWPIEVWNEPNLPGFWEHADKPKYLHLYEVSARAIKALDPRFKVGGPAICGGSGSQEWVKDFLTFCRDNKVPVDFVTRHAYMGQQPHHEAEYLYHTMCDVEFTYQEMKTTREIIDSFPEYCGIPMHITEFNTSYNPRCPIHDTKLNAAIMSGFLSRMGDVADSYSYWTFGDVFEETGVPRTPFHGGFGLVADGLIAKPTMWAFSFFANLQGKCVYRDDDMIVMLHDDGSYEGIVWNECRLAHKELHAELTLPVADGRYVQLVEHCSNVNDPAKAWHDMGEPDTLSQAQLTYLRRTAQPFCTSDVLAASEGKVIISLDLDENDVLHFVLQAAPLNPDEGYQYDYYEHHPETWAAEHPEA